jgi:methanogenic corrinoid protein MtbC1
LTKAAVAGDISAAWTIVNSSVTPEMTCAEVADQFVAPAQRRVGDLWESGAISIADEHTATAVSVDVMRRATEFCRSPDTSTAGRIMLVSAPREWHRIPVDTLAMLLAGGEVVVPPLASSAGQMVAWIHDEGPECLVLSCTMPANLEQAMRVAAVAHKAHLPLIAGGRAFAETPGASELGVDTVDNFSQLVARLDDRRIAPPEAIFEGTARRLTELEGWCPELNAAMVDGVQDLDFTGDPVADALWVARAFVSAVACLDPAIIEHQLTWQQRRHEAAGVVSGVRLGQVLRDAVASVVPAQLPAVEAGTAGVAGVT